MDACASEQSQVSHNFSSNVESSPTKWQCPPCIVCSESHKLLYCPKFKDLTLAGRVKLVDKHGLCENCLMSNHVTNDCRKQSVCTVDGCGKRHTRLIHQIERVSDSNQVLNAYVTSKMGIQLPIVTVKVNDDVMTNVLLATGSSSTFCTKKLIDQLKIEGCDVEIVLNTLNKSEEQSTKSVKPKLMSVDDRSSLSLSNVLVVDKIPTASCKFHVEAYPHLTDLSLADSSRDTDILIGQDNVEALIPLDVRHGKAGEPCAVRTMFGWSVQGPMKFKNSQPNQINSNVTSSQIAGKTLCRNQVDKVRCSGQSSLGIWTHDRG